MITFMRNPDIQLRVYGMDLEQDDSEFASANNSEYEYDEFIGKWIKQHKQRRAQKRAEKGKPPRRSLIQVIKRQPNEGTAKNTVKDNLIPTESLAINPITNTDLKVHKVINNAMQNELKTLQEEQKVEGLKKKVQQEEMKKETLKQQAGLMGAGKGLLVVVGVLGTIGLLAYLNNSKQSPVATTLGVK